MAWGKTVAPVEYDWLWRPSVLSIGGTFKRAIPFEPQSSVIWVIFSSKVIRGSRSSMRWSTGSLGSR